MNYSNVTTKLLVLSMLVTAVSSSFAKEHNWTRGKKAALVLGVGALTAGVGAGIGAAACAAGTGAAVGAGVGVATGATIAATRDSSGTKNYRNHERRCHTSRCERRQENKVMAEPKGAVAKTGQCTYYTERKCHSSGCRNRIEGTDRCKHKHTCRTNRCKRKHCEKAQAIK